MHTHARTHAYTLGRDSVVVFNTKPEGVRPKLRWEDGVNQDMETLEVEKWKNAALERDEWTRLVKKARFHQ